MMSETRFERRAERGTVVVHVYGDVDMQTAREFKQALLEAAGDGQSTVAVDLTGCTYIDSAGLGVLIVTYNSLGHPYPVIVPENSFVRQLFTIAGVDSLFILSETPADIAPARRLHSASPAVNDSDGSP